MSSSNLPQKIIIVDPDRANLNLCKNICEKRRINVVAASDWQSATYQFNNNKFEIAIVALSINEMPGPILLQKWRHHEIEVKRECSFILCTGQQKNAEHSAIAQEIGDTHWLYLPFKEPNLIGLLAQAMANKKQRDQIQQLKTKVIQPLIDQGNIDSLREIARTKLPEMGPRGQELAAEVFEKINDILPAIDQYHDLRKQIPQNMRFVNEIGRLEMVRGNMEEAKRAFEIADKAAPKNIMRLSQMATMYLKLHNPDAAVEKFKTILENDPENPDQKYDMFDLLAQSGYEKHAQEFCKDTTTPLELIRYFNNKGVMLSKSSDYRGAIEEYAKAEKLIPGSKELYRILYNKALAYINLKQPEHLEAAKAILHKCLDINKKYDKAKEKLELVNRYLNKAG